MKIALCGASNIGKTSLLKPLSEEMNLSIIQYTIFSVMEKWNLKNQDEAIIVGSTIPRKGINFQKNIIVGGFDYFDFEINVKNNNNFITDRIPLDGLLYYMIHNCYWDTKESTQDLIDLVKKSSEFYDYVFTFNTGLFPVENNGIRGVNPAYHKMTQTVIEYLAELTNYRLIKVPDDVLSIEDRVAWIKNYIKNN